MAELKIADPVPLGLAAFGVTLMMLSSANAGLWNGAGGAAVVRRHPSGTDGSAFWLSVWYWLTTPAVQAKGSLGVFLLMFTIASFVMWICAIKLGTQLNALFFLLFVTLVLLTLGNWDAGNANMVKTGGYAGMLTAALALYLVAKSMINDVWGRKVLP